MTTKKILRLGLVVPHIFIHHKILPQVIFSPGNLAIDLSNGISQYGVDVTFFSPGKANVKTKNLTADMSYFEDELKGRGDDYIDLLKKHPFTFVTLARQVQAELLAQAFAMANSDQLDIVHIYTNEEDIALPFTKLCKKPVVFTHHDPYNFLVKYKNVFPKYKSLPFISLSYAQRKSMPKDTNWVANIYHGLDKNLFQPEYSDNSNYLLYLGRIIEPKGVHLAIEAVTQYNKTHRKQLKLKIAGKYYSDTYFDKTLKPYLEDDNIEYIGYIKDKKSKQKLLAGAKALIIPSLFDEPFGMVMIEALACGTPLIGLDSGAIPEIIDDTKTGFLVQKANKDSITIMRISKAIEKIHKIDQRYCRAEFEKRFTLERMCKEHANCYQQLVEA